MKQKTLPKQIDLWRQNITDLLVILASVTPATILSHGVPQHLP